MKNLKIYEIILEFIEFDLAFFEGCFYFYFFLII